MTSKIAITGATGRVGAPTAEILEAAGHDVVRIARSTGVDVITGAGLDEALAGVDVVIDTATGPSPDQDAATEFFTTSARNIQAAAHGAGVRRIVLVSIIGIDAFEGGYNAAKVAQEETMLAGPVPVRILRAAQFHEFVEQLLEWGTQGDVAYVWAMQTQLVAARVVAEALADLAADEGERPVRSEIAGPRAERLVEMAALLVEHRGGGLRVEEAPRDPDDADAERYAQGTALPGPGATLAGPTFAEWLATQPAGATA
jgi:uncharacterized protein YbjT (DUF2867 family)